MMAEAFRSGIRADVEMMQRILETSDEQFGIETRLRLAPLDKRPR